MNPDATGFQRQFATEIKRCYEMERKIRYLEAEIIKDGIKIVELDDLPRAPLPKEMIDLEAALDKMDHELREINVNAEVKDCISIIKFYCHQVTHHHVMPYDITDMVPDFHTCQLLNVPQTINSFLKEFKRDDGIKKLVFNILEYIIFPYV